MSIIAKAKYEGMWLTSGMHIVSIRTPEELEERFPDGLPEYADGHWKLIDPVKAIERAEKELANYEEILARFRLNYAKMKGTPVSN